MLGTVISDSAWKQACLPISKTGVGIRDAVDQLKAAFNRSVSQADALGEQITGEKITDNQIFKETVDELKNLEISQYTQHKIQEALDDAAFSDLLGNQISNRERARLLSRCLNLVPGFPHLQSLVWAFTFSQMHSELRWSIGLVLRYTLRNENAPTVKTADWTSWVNTLWAVMIGGYDIAAR